MRPRRSRPTGTKNGSENRPLIHYCEWYIVL